MITNDKDGFFELKKIILREKKIIGELESLINNLNKDSGEGQGIIQVQINSLKK